MTKSDLNLNLFLRNSRQYFPEHFCSRYSVGIHKAKSGCIVKELIYFLFYSFPRLHSHQVLVANTTVPNINTIITAGRILMILFIMCVRSFRFHKYVNFSIRNHLANRWPHFPSYGTFSSLYHTFKRNLKIIRKLFQNSSEFLPSNLLWKWGEEPNNPRLQVFSHLTWCNSISFLKCFLKVAISIVTNRFGYLYNGQLVMIKKFKSFSHS